MVIDSLQLNIYLPLAHISEDDEVIPIYETSINFQGYIAQSYSHFTKNCDYYIFCADDLLLNPDFNENNIIERLNCKKPHTLNI